MFSIVAAPFRISANSVQGFHRCQHLSFGLTLEFDVEGVLKCSSSGDYIVIILSLSNI